MTKVLSLLGVALAILLSIAVTVPYVIAWLNLGSESREINVANIKGETIVFGGEHSSLVNITLFAVYPKAAVEAKSNMFVTRLVFLVILDSGITEFICDEIRTNFRSLARNYDYYGLEGLSFSTGRLVDFYRRWREEGNIAPFSANVSMAVHSGRWPQFSQDMSHMLYLTDRIETAPHTILSARIRTINGTSSSISVFFDMTKYATIVYRFNFPPTVWIAYGSSLFIIVAILVNLLYRRQHKKE